MWRTLECVERDFNRSQFQEIARENGANLTEGISGLNMNSSFHVDSSVFQQGCDECDIVYEVGVAFLLSSFTRSFPRSLD